ncbi:7TM diverse intracellular signaling domain-containing protein [Oligoflexus tunisiensis]|uniref:7TM diverse intracellular signaling domain-containing protein n=1 Tax=Oligoflexus tunisiensis TaxID=708132 RepID=UPI00159F2485|nr:7TM diverse intracellular signaling domain-containing protein [Oligoflexus tunisiensis]
MDLRQWNFEQNPSLPLRGHWQFHWSKFIEPLAFQSPTPPPYELIKVPGSWTKAEKPYPRFGYATYRAHIRLAKVEELALYVPVIYAASRIFIDGKLIAEIGKVGPEAEPQRYTPRIAERYYTFLPRGLEFDIVIHASSFEIYRAGLTHSPPALGKPAAIALERERDIGFAFSILGALAIMGLYHICLFALRTDDRSSLYFGLLCLVLAIYMLAGKGRVVDIIVPGISFAGIIRTHQVWMLAPAFFSFFTHELFPRYFSKRLAQAMVIINGSFVIYTIFAEPRDFIDRTAVIQILTAVVIIYLVRVMTLVCLRREDGAKTFSAGAFIMATVTIHDILLIQEVFESVPIGAFGLLTFIFFQSFLLARRFSSAFHRVAESEHEVRKLSEDLKAERDQILHLNENLETIVEDKTRDIRSIMTHIQLGIFTLAPPEFSIQKDYSDHLKCIFKQDDLVNLNGLHLLFAHSNLTSDDRSQAESALVVSLGENLVAFQMNQHCLPREIVWKQSDDHRVLDLTWNPIADEQDNVEKVLVTVRDVTDIRALEAQTRDKDTELEIIGELLNASPESIDRFFASCHEYLSDNRKFVRACRGQDSDLDLIKIAFINFHTIKGTARSLKFRNMTKVLHEIEQFYANVLTQHHSQWDIARMYQSVDEVEALVRTYEAINCNKLGRQQNPEWRVEVSETQIAELYRNVSRMESFLRADAGPEGKELFHAIKSSMFPYIYVSVADVFMDACKATEVLAKDLGKALPTLSVAGDGIFLSRKGEGLLRKILVHMIRNTMDHGLETPQERLASGKRREGHIELQMKKEKDGALLIYRDDGRGLDLHTIGEIAVRKGFIANRSGLSDQQLVDLIFHAGLSTAHSVNDISGRGVGMDAVRRYVQSEGGDVRVRVEGRGVDTPFHPFRIEIDLPQNLLAQDSAEFLSRLSSKPTLPLTG